LKGSGVASDLNAKYKNAPGLVLQADYRFTEKFAAGLRYTSVTYKADAFRRAPSQARLRRAPRPTASVSSLPGAFDLPG